MLAVLIVVVTGKRTWKLLPTESCSNHIVLFSHKFRIKVKHTYRVDVHHVTQVTANVVSIFPTHYFYFVRFLYVLDTGIFKCMCAWLLLLSLHCLC